MRPIPQNRHLWAVMILMAAAALAGYLALRDDELSSQQVNIAAAAIKRHDPGAFAHDPIYGDSRLWLFHTPAYQSMLELMLVPADYQDMLLPFRVAVAAQTLLLLCGMYALLFWQTRNWSISVFTAVMSVRLIEVLGGGVWGSGPLASVTPAGLCLALWPAVVLAFARYSQPEPGVGPSGQWRVILVFIAVGLLGNIHLVTAMNMTVVLLIAYVIRQRFSPLCLPVAFGAAAAAFFAAMPYVWYYFGLRARMVAGHASAEAGTLFEAIRVGELTQFYPQLLQSLLDWRVLAGALVLGLPGAVVLVKIERYRTQNVRLWVGLVAGSLAVSLGFHGASQLGGKLLGTAPPVIDFAQASALLLLPLYVLLGQAVTNLFRLLRTHRTILRWALTAVLAAWMIPSDNLRVARWRLAEFSTSFLSEEDKPNYVLRHREKLDAQRELGAIADFAGERSGSMYITDRGEFRILSRRPIVAAPNDLRYLYYLAPWRLGQWLDSYRQQEKLFPAQGTTDPKAAASFVTDLIANDPSLAGVSEWYVLLRAQTAPVSPQPLQPVESGAWGRHYKLYRVR